MPSFQLQLKADLENLDVISCADDIVLYISVECGQCGEGSDKLISITKAETVDVPGGKGEAHLVKACKGCRKEGNIVIDDKRGFGTFLSEGDWSTMATLEARGITVVGWKAKDGFIAKKGDTAFDGVDLSEDFADYNEDTEESVSIMNVETRVNKC